MQEGRLLIDVIMTTHTFVKFAFDLDKELFSVILFDSFSYFSKETCGYSLEIPLLRNKKHIYED